MKLDLNKLISKIVITCPKCRRIPFLTIIPINTLILVRSTCPCFTRTIPLYEYMRDLRVMSKKKTHQCQNVLSHQKKSNSICLQCHLYLCKDCIDHHQTNFPSHQITEGNWDIKKDIFDDPSHIGNCNFCYNCFTSFCNYCDHGHNGHFFSTFHDFRRPLLSMKIKENFKISVEYKNILSYSYLTIANKINKKNEELTLSFRKCIYRNEKILTLIEMIILTCLNVEKEGFCYQACANVFMNTNFTVTEENYKKLPTLKTVNDYIDFFNNFNVITQKFILKEYDNNKIEKIKYFPSEGRKNQGYLLFEDKTTLLFGHGTGTLYVYDIQTDSIVSVIPSIHQHLITSLHLLNKDTLLSSSFDSTIKMWKMQREGKKLSLELLRELNFKGSSEGIQSVLPISEDKIAIITIERNFMIYSIEDKNNCLLYKKDFPQQINLVLHLTKDKRSLVLIDKKCMYLYDTETLQEESHNFEGDLEVLSDYSLFEGKNNKLYLNAIYKEIYSVIVFNLKSRAIETIFKPFLIHARENISKAFSFNFLDEIGNDIYIKTIYNQIVSFNTVTYELTAIIPRRFSCFRKMKIEKIKQNLYLSINKNHLKLWEM